MARYGWVPKQTLTGFGGNGSSQSNSDGTEMKVLIAER